MANIFDTHLHVGSFGINFMKQREVDIFGSRDIKNAEDMKAFMKTNKVSKALIVPYYNSDIKYPFIVGNKAVLAILNDSKLSTAKNKNNNLENVYGALWVSPLKELAEHNDEILTGKLLDNEQLNRKTSKNLLREKIVALKFSHNSWPEHTTADPKTWKPKFRIEMEKILDFAHKNDLVIHLHTASESAVINAYGPFIKEYGERNSYKLKFQFVHMGNSAAGIIAFVPRFIEWLQAGYNFYCDTSGAWGFGPEWLINEMQKKHPAGLNNILFASDYPWGNFQGEYWKISGINCDNGIKEKIFWENADRLYCR
ncbi:amidohydrolase family protein [Candidatus Woesearchaeota archaeon]|nr:amidohydrolase family protein [Candidatus Woesearchaeota archaeon]